MRDSEKPKSKVSLKEYGKNIQKLVDRQNGLLIRKKGAEYAFATGGADENNSSPAKK